MGARAKIESKFTSPSIPSLEAVLCETLSERQSLINILRGHKAQVQAAAFIRRNERLATADADGFIVLWDLAVMRPAAVWKAHDKSILGVMGWGLDKIITHGRDHKLVVWKLSASDEEGLSSVLPVEPVVEARRQPWILHLVEVNALNFCAFAACARRPDGTLSGPDASSELLLAVPNALASEAVDVFALPDQSRLHTVRPSGSTTGLVMSLRLLHLAGCLTLIAGFENGSVSVRRLEAAGAWITTYSSQPHSQPVLSLDVHPNHECFFSSSADSILAQHPLPTAQRFCSGDAGASQVGDMEPWKHPLKTVNTKHFGQQSLSVRSDGKILATAGWDSKVRVYSAKTLNELAVLQWHKVGAYAVAFADLVPAETQSCGQQESSVVKPSDENASTSMGAKTSLVGKELTTVKHRRMRAALTTHWIAAGAKDGKVSLWQVY
ncbi:hypothetical protein CDD80_4407 [Ophiocordyceps camponoti-rufipedis]|uniref:ASTRA-associated protein 1 n=1 Tax=Ophiocordyceps camponoti-rufipedis TaxID=2004952 RepID=A0A2C5YV28_9HYPO|nr:hypothetical protein CDD80_4407 [Ophiocordyceps camponoti-rufipedis]